MSNSRLELSINAVKEVISRRPVSAAMIQDREICILGGAHYFEFQHTCTARGIEFNPNDSRADFIPTWNVKGE